ncbi:hypothetical protein ANO11243_062010 [Dothideomycetidae sp. 11243]|nr:hypothetical protein ANO11243_062010 [fungal sp. No.11243]
MKKVLVGYGIDVDAVSGWFKSIEVLTRVTGKRPRGWTAPAWTASPHTVALLEEAGIEYDHSFMHHDCHIYALPYSDYNCKPTEYKRPNGRRPNASAWMAPMPPPKISSVVTVPANWHLDDWPPFTPGDGGSNGFIDPHMVERMWKEHFEYYYESYDDFVFPLSIHPQISAKPHVLQMHKRMIEWLNGFEGVEWCTFGDMVDCYKQGGTVHSIVDAINGTP